MDNRRGATKIGIAVGLLVAVAVVVAIISLLLLDVTGKRGSGLGEQFLYDTKNLTKIDPNLILYEQLRAPVATGFQVSRAIAVGRAGHVFVAGDKAVRIFADDAGLKFISEIKLQDSPRCLTVSENGRIYIGMKNYVSLYDSYGKFLTNWKGLGSDAVLTSIAVSGDKVFVADAGNRIVLQYDMDGNLISRIGKKDKDRNISGFVIPSAHFDLAVADDGLLRVVNPGRHRIEAYTFAGDLEFWWGEFSAAVTGFCGCCNPVSFAMFEDDSFVTVEKGLIRAKIYDADGEFVGVVAGPEQLVDGVASICETVAECEAGSFDVAVDSDGHVLILDTIKNVIRTFKKIKAN